MENDTLLNIQNEIATTSLNTGGVNIWMIIAIVEACLIIILLLTKKNDGNLRSIKKEVLSEGDVDFADILNSSFNANSLYKDLLAACHPDKYATDEEKLSIANDISARLSLNKHSVKALQELKKEAIEKLGINM